MYKNWLDSFDTTKYKYEWQFDDWNPRLIRDRKRGTTDSTANWEDFLSSSPLFLESIPLLLRSLKRHTQTQRKMDGGEKEKKERGEGKSRRERTKKEGKEMKGGRQWLDGKLLHWGKGEREKIHRERLSEREGRGYWKAGNLWGVERLGNEEKGNE